MPLQLPAARIAGPVAFEPFGSVLGNSRVTRFRYTLLSRTEKVVRELTTVEGGGSLEWAANSAVKGGGTFVLSDTGEAVDWLNARIQISAELTPLDRHAPVPFDADDPEVVRVPLGVWLPAAPVESWTARGRRWQVELTDKLAILDQDIPTDGNGVPVTYSLDRNAHVINNIRALIRGAGEPDPPAISSPLMGKRTRTPMTWELGTSRLKIINDLLDASGYFSLWCDGAGQYRVSEYVVPSQRPPVYSAASPFKPGATSLMDPTWSRDRDIYSVPNRYVAISSATGDEPALVATVTNENPASPFSFPSRGRWITRVVTGVEAVSQADLLTRAQMGMAQATAVTSGIDIKHALLPDLQINQTVRFEAQSGDGVLCYVQSTKVPLDPTELCSSTLREATI